MTPIEEHPVLFGPTSTLFGVLTRPAVDAPAPVACLMSNFGVTHHVGPRRIQVKLARRLAREGVATLRFDMSGIGDSPPSRSARAFDDQAQDDLRAAIDHVQTALGIDKVVVFGLCSGVPHGLRLALADDRVTGLLAFDGYRFPGRWSNTMRLLQRFRKAPFAQGAHWIKRLLGAARPKDNMLERDDPENRVTAAAFARSMDALVARDIAVYLIYSATQHKHDRNKDQLLALRGAPFLDKVRYEFMPGVDHSFTLISGQAFFSDAVCSWVREVAQKVSQRATAPGAATLQDNHPARRATASAAVRPAPSVLA